VDKVKFPFPFSRLATSHADVARSPRRSTPAVPHPSTDPKRPQRPRPGHASRHAPRPVHARTHR
jgi:hypothetical protein